MIGMHQHFISNRKKPAVRAHTTAAPQSYTPLRKLHTPYQIHHPQPDPITPPSTYPLAHTQKPHYTPPYTPPYTHRV